MVSFSHSKLPVESLFLKFNVLFFNVCLLTQGQIRLLPADRRGKSQAESQPEQSVVDKQVETSVAPNLNYQFFSSIFKLNENFEFTTAWYRQEAWQA